MEKNAKKSKTYQTGNREKEHGQNTNNDRTGSEGNTETKYTDTDDQTRNR